MFGRARSDLSSSFWVVATGAGAGLAAGYLLRRLRPGRSTALEVEGRARRLEDDVVSALSSDAVLGGRPIEVAMLTDGIIELTGSVGTEEEGQLAVERAQDVPAVRTVLNRLDVGMLESHLAETRRRYDEGEPGLHETHWYGMRVGTGRRRQGHETDPDRPDDKVPMKSRDLGADRVLGEASERLDKAAPGGEKGTSGPAGPLDRGTAERASMRRLGNPPESLQDINPAAGVHENVQEGTGLTMEETGLDDELAESERRERERGRERGPERG